MTVQSLVGESKVDRRIEDKQRLSRSVEELVQEGKWLSRADQLHLADRLTRYFHDFQAARPSAGPSLAECFDYQNHLVVYLLNNNSVPVPRTQLLCLMQLGSTFKYNEHRKCYEIEVCALRPVA